MPSISLSNLERRASNGTTPVVKALIASTVILVVIVVVVLWMYHVSRRNTNAALKELARLTKKQDKLQQRWKDVEATFNQSQYDRLEALNEYEIENTRLRQALNRSRMRRGSQKRSAASQIHTKGAPNNATFPSPPAQSYLGPAPHSAPLRGSDEQSFMRPPTIPSLLAMKSFSQDMEDMNAVRTAKVNQETTKEHSSEPDTSPKEPRTHQEKLLEYEREEPVFLGPNHPQWPFISSGASDHESNILVSTRSTAS